MKKDGKNKTRPHTLQVRLSADEAGRVERLAAAETLPSAVFARRAIVRECDRLDAAGTRFNGMGDMPQLDGDLHQGWKCSGCGHVYDPHVELVMQMRARQVSCPGIASQGKEG